MLLNSDACIIVKQYAIGCGPIKLKLDFDKVKYKMEKTFDEVREQVFNEVMANTETILNTLTNFWTTMYANDMVVSNAKIFVEHVDTFYKEIIGETIGRQNIIKTSIDELYSEASSLKVMLTSDIDLQPDIPLYPQQLHLADCIKNLTAQKTKRETKMRILLKEQKALCNDLGEQPRELNFVPVLPTDDELIEFRQYLDELIVDKQARQNHFEIVETEIFELFSKLESYYEISPYDEAILDDPVPLTRNSLLKLEDLRKSLQVQYRSMCEEIDKIKIQVANIWKVLKMDDEGFKKQFDTIEYNFQTLTELAHQFNYWKQQRELQIEQKVLMVRQQILECWQNVLYSESERAKFSSFTSNLYTEELLLEHEKELKRLQLFYTTNETLFRLIEERNQIFQRLQTLDENARAPGRFSNRGGQLLQDQRETQAIVKRLNVITLELDGLASAYEQSTNQIFTVNGKPLADLKTEALNQIGNRTPARTPRRSLRIQTTPLRSGNVTYARGIWGEQRRNVPVPNNLT